MNNHRGNIQNEIIQEEHDGNLNAKKARLVGFELLDTNEDTTNITYVGLEDASGRWLIKKLDETSNLDVSYATQRNNSTYTTYATAWAALGSLTFGSWSTAAI